MSRPRRRPRGVAFLLLRLCAPLVPAAERAVWRASWEAELSELLARRRRGATRTSPIRFAIGALPHSLWERKEWTMSVLLQDVRYAARVLLRTPSFTILAVLTVALGVGASTTVFSLVSATVLRPPAGIADPERVVQIGRQNEGGYDSFAYPYVRAFAGAGALESVAAYTYRTMIAGAGDGARATVGQLVTGGYFDLLGVDAVAGRTFGPADDTSAEPVVMVSARLAAERFGGAGPAVGSDLVISGRPFRVVGVVEPGFGGTDVATPRADLWVPLAIADQVLGAAYADFDQPGFSWLWVLGRLADGAELDRAHDEVDAIYRTLHEASWGAAPDLGVILVRGPGLRPEERQTVAGLVSVLLGIVVVVMLVASANLGSLMLARGAARVREMGIRVSIGASRTRLVRQLLTESLLVSLAGGALALVATIWTARLLPSLMPWSLGVEIGPDRNVLLFGIACSVLVGVLFGALPALRAGAGNVVEALREGGDRAGSGGLLLRRGLVVGQLALSFALLVVVALLAQSVWKGRQADPGFATDDVLVARFDLDLAGYEPDRGAIFRRQLLDRVRALPGVRSATLGTNVPFAGWSRQSVPLPEPLPDGTTFFQADTTSVSSHYFETLGMSLVRGAGFTSEVPLRADEVVISESAARLLFPDSDPLAGTLPFLGAGDETFDLRVAGIVADVRNRGLRIDPRPSVYLPDSFGYNGRAALFVRTQGASLGLESAIRGVVREVDPNVTLLSVRGLHDVMADSLSDTRLVGRLAGVFGALALILAAVGLYGVVAYLVSRRTHEVGVRMALGAAGGDVVRMIARQGLALGLIGLGLGLAIAVPVGGAVAALLYGVSPQSPAAIAAAAGLLAAVVLTASVLPARWATRIDPARALRAE